MKFLKILAFVAIISLPQITHAATFKSSSGGVVIVNQNEVVKNLYVASQNVEVNSYVMQDLVAAGSDVKITGSVEDDLIAAGEKLDIKGMVGGNARVGGGNVVIENKIGEDLLAAGSNIQIQNTASISGDLLAAGSDIVIDGSVDGNAKIVGKNITINGRINGDLEVKNAENIYIKKTAFIGGNFIYSSINQAQIENGASIKNVQFEKISKTDLYRSTEFWKLTIYKLISLLVLLLFLVWLFPAFVKNSVEQFHTNILKNLGVGILALIFTPVASIILLIIPFTVSIGLVLLLLYILYLILSFALIPLFLGNFLAKALSKTRQDKVDLEWPVVLFGAILTIILGIIPIVGPLLLFVLMLLALGMLVNITSKALKK